MKNDLAGGKFPSGSFGENAAWWWCMILAFNLNALMKHLVLRGEWKKKRMKAIRYWIITIPARIIAHSRELIIRLRKEHPSFALIKNARLRIMELGRVPVGLMRDKSKIWGVKKLGGGFWFSLNISMSRWYNSNFLPTLNGRKPKKLINNFFIAGHKIR